MRITPFLGVVTSLVALVAIAAEAACSSSAPTVSAPDDAGRADVALIPPSDDAGARDATTPPTDAAPAVPIGGMLDVRASGATPTTVHIGAFKPTAGNAQWRARPSAGGVLTVKLEEDVALSPRRSIEVTLYDDAGTLAASETFPADAPGGFAIRGARVETYQGSTGWRTEGDGVVSVLAIDAVSVTLKLTNVAQFTQESAGQDTFILDGTVTVPLMTLPKTSVGAASVVISNLQNEPVSGEACNMTTPSQALASATTILDDVAYPFTSNRRATAFSDVSAGVSRNLRIAFPSGHLPRLGRSVTLSKFDRVQITYFEGPSLIGASTEKVWEAALGTLHVDAATATSMTLRLEAAGMQSESPSAKGNFQLDGTVTVALPPAP